MQQQEQEQAHHEDSGSYIEDTSMYDYDREDGGRRPQSRASQHNTRGNEIGNSLGGYGGGSHHNRTGGSQQYKSSSYQYQQQFGDQADDDDDMW